MWLVLCDSTDAPARWAHEGLRRRGLEPVELVTSDDLAHARWVHTVGADGGHVQVELRDGRAWSGDEVVGVLNRLVYPPQGDLLLIHPSDRTYAVQELMAFFMSWLHALPGPVLNQPTPGSLCGRARTPGDWVCLAGRAGLPAPRFRQSSDAAAESCSLHVRLPMFTSDLRTITVVGGTVVGARAPAPIQEGCCRLAGLAKTALLGVEFSVGPGERWEFAGATCLPDLRLGGDPLLDALASSLKARRGGDA